ncbi:type 1 glutamine amidotransferase [Sinorhizobium sp. GL28]|uniref:type 1 glutamine amidotransferase n=1 Tax=Sinorhizobium sp. GL28 TaxID=1358418 RepID=UPI00072A1079|nr:type 1 glutamine amidotransferase [Sinorhizobium sp. GL28]KSV84173.1 hypothetical protein N184_12835 [Sinorhizobium sp. GL28]
MKRALVLQHVDRDHPGRFLDFFAADDILPEVVRLWAGEEIPNLASFDFMFALGGPQDTWQEAEYPWLVMEKEVIREWVAVRAKPYFGVCLGHQLLCDALGGEVGFAERGEHGIHNVDLTEVGKSHRLCSGLEQSNPVVQWHMAEVKRVPEGGVILASSDRCVTQCVAINDHAVGTQFHSECSPQTVAGWTATPGYVPLYEKHRGPGSYRQFVEEAYPLMGRMTAMTRRIYDNLVESSGLRK